MTRDEALESFPAEGAKLSANDNEAVHISHIQLILAEKRTSLAVLRTGIVVLSLPLSVVTVLIATSRYYDFLGTYHLIDPALSAAHPQSGRSDQQDQERRSANRRLFRRHAVKRPSERSSQAPLTPATLRSPIGNAPTRPRRTCCFSSVFDPLEIYFDELP